MHVGLIIYGELDTTSGGYLYDRQLVRHLQQHGDDVQLISLPWSRYGRHLLQNIDSALLRQLTDSSFDVLLQDELNHPSLFWLNKKLRSRTSYPLVSIVHHLRSNESHPIYRLKFFRWIERQYLRTIDGFIFNSETTSVSVETLLGKQKPHVVAYPAADHCPTLIDRTFVLSRARSAGPLRLLFVGNVIPRKACHVLLSALASLPQGSWHLDIVGSTAVAPDYVRQLKQQASSSGISSYITWHGRLSDTGLTKQLANSQLLVVPSTYEGFGIAYLEGMHHGLPAIATTSGAAHEIITDGKDGFLVPPDDPKTLANRIRTLNEDRSLLARLSLAARERSKTHPTWQISMADVRQFLLGITR